MAPEIHIISYFSLPTDLAAEMRAWPEIQEGSGYNVNHANGSETVSVTLEARDEIEFVRVRGSGPGPLFDRVLGRVTHALSAHSDNLQVSRRP